MRRLQSSLPIALTAILTFLLVAPSSAPAQSGGSGSSGGSAQLKENLDLPYDAIGLEEEDEDAPEVIVFYGQNYEGDGIFYCLDRSGSTRGAPIAKEKREVIRNINEFSSRVEFGIAFYDGGLIYHPGNSRPARAEPGPKSAAIAWVNSVQSGSGSCFDKGLAKCIQFANASSAKRNVIIYLGDGCPTCPGRNRSTYAQETLNRIRGLNFKRHQINAIVVGNVCPEFPTALAQQNNGTYTQL